MSGAGENRRKGRAWQRTALFVSICAFSFIASRADAQNKMTGLGEDCTLSERSAPRAVVSVIDGATLALDNGMQVRLIGTLAPSSLDADPGPDPPNHSAGDDGEEEGSEIAANANQQRNKNAPDTWQPAVAAREALARFVDGRSVTVATAGRQRDRYGRVLGHVFVDGPANTGSNVGANTRANSGGAWLQGEMLATGHARAYGITDNYDCMDALVAAEAPARAARLGLWANPAYAIRSAALTRNLMHLRGTYQIVAGVVRASKRVKSGWIYLNFGKNWRSDFSASISPDVTRAHPAWAAALLDLKGRRVRVRGWIERRNGPAINIEHPSQIEFVDAVVSTSAPAPPRTLSER